MGAIGKERVVSVVLAVLALLIAGGQAVTRVHYIAAVEVEWDYAPLKVDVFNGEPFNPTRHPWVANGEDLIGSTYVKALYREFTDETFTVMKSREPEWEHLGLLGPTLHAEVGDVLEIHFQNMARFNFTMHPHGVLYERPSEGAQQAGLKIPGASVAPGEKYVYVWEVPESAGPGPSDPSSVVWLYHSHVHEVTDTNAGLVGAIVVTRKGEAGSDGRPLDVDVEYVVLLTVMDENLSPLLVENMRRAFGSVDPDLIEDEDFQESNLLHCINGYVFGNQPGLNNTVNERVRWYMLSLGNENDLHVAHWHGNTLLKEGHRTDVIELFPASMRVLDMTPTNPGHWLFHCHTNDHIEGGMVSYYTVMP